MDDSQVTFHRPLASEFVSVASEEVTHGTTYFLIFRLDGMCSG